MQQKCHVGHVMVFVSSWASTRTQLTGRGLLCCSRALFKTSGGIVTRIINQKTSVQCSHCVNTVLRYRSLYLQNHIQTISISA